MSKTTITIGAITCCLIFAADCTADLLLNIAVESVQDIEPKIKQSQLQLRPGKDYLKIVESDLELIYDFDTSRMLWINRTEHYYSDTSLYAAVVGREHELKNRQYLRGILREAGDSTAPLELSEHELSMPLGPVQITKKQGTDNIDYVHDGKVLLSRIRASTPVAEQEPEDYSLQGLSQRYDVNPMLHKLAGKLVGSLLSARVDNEKVLLVPARGAHSLPWSESERTAIAADSQVKQLFAAIQNLKDQDDARAALDALEDEPTEQYMLNLFAANIHAKLGEIGKVKMLIGTALEENPYIVSAWIDLGEFYFLDFDPKSAWFCWDIARHLHPDHHLLVKTSTLEQRLAKKYPYFF